MAMLVTDSDRPSPKVWQPWYIEDGDSVGKELPTRSQREQRLRERIALQKPSNMRAISPAMSSDDEEIDVSGLPPETHVYSYSRVANPFPEDDIPLDMSTKRRLSPSPPSIPPPAHTPNHSLTPPLLQRPPPPAHSTTSQSSPQHLPSRLSSYPSPAFRGRPSVITCAPSGGFLHGMPTYPSPTHDHTERYAPPPPYNVAAAHLLEQRMGIASRVAMGGLSPSTSESGRKTPERPSSEESFSSKRHIVQAGPVDPEIDEHFRRSLGCKYHELFISESGTEQSAEPNDSVDDHFAKALGETWTKLKAGKGSARPPTKKSFASSSAGCSPATTPPPRRPSNTKVFSTSRSPTPSDLTFKYKRSYDEDAPLSLTAKTST